MPDMPNYLLNLYQPDEGVPAPEDLRLIMERLSAINGDLDAVGASVLIGGVEHPGGATVVAALGDDEVDVAAGPYLPGPVHVGGFWVLDVPNEDEALGWAQRIAAATTLPVEVVPLTSVTRP